MRKTIKDSIPGAGPARTAYLCNRIERALGEYKLKAAELALDPAADGEGIEARLTLRPTSGIPVTLTTTKRTLPVALENVFEAAQYRLRFGAVHKGTARQRARILAGAA